MRLVDCNNWRPVEAELTTEHAASSYGQPVLVLKRNGRPLDAVSVTQYGLVEATADERAQLGASPAYGAWYARELSEMDA